MNQGDVEVPRASIFIALAPILVLIGLLGINVVLFGEDSSYGPNQIALLLAAAGAAIAGFWLKIPFSLMLRGVEKAIGSALTAMLILLLIGSLAGTWMMSGIVPAMIYYGLDILNPKIFLFASAVVCAIVSVASGSSWSTVATVGIALLGIGSALGVNEALAAGAIISGAYFGDKISPLSDTTNLAAAMAGTELIRHIKYMLWTTIPSFTIALAIYLAIGFSGEPTALVTDTAALKSEVASHFNTLSPALLMVPLVVLVMVVLKFDAVAALFVGAVLGGVLAIACQPKMVTAIAALPDVEFTDPDTEKVTTKPPSYLKRSYVAFINSMSFETAAVSEKATDAAKADLSDAKLASARRQTGNPNLTQKEFEKLELKLDETFPEKEAKVAAAKLLQGKGMKGMLNTIWLILTAMCFGGIMEACGFLRRITEPLVAMSQSNGALVATTAGSCMFVNTTASDQYLAIVVPGQMFRETFEERGLAPENLSRTLEDSGTVTSVLIPRNTCGAAQSGVLGVDVLLYAPYCFFNWISPLMTITFGYLGIGIAKLKNKKSDAS